MAFERPLCNRLLYNRWRQTSEFRGEAVPEDLLRSPGQRDVLHKLKEYYPGRVSRPVPADVVGFTLPIRCGMRTISGEVAIDHLHLLQP